MGGIALSVEIKQMDEQRRGARMFFFYMLLRILRLF